MLSEYQAITPSSSTKEWGFSCSIHHIVIEVLLYRGELLFLIKGIKTGRGGAS